ncbi:MAG: septal ring lytic transglycosylase RlpA family protein [Acidobacteria bacterium]|nr:septal ring lytic transglycosylase RlpA family protein [Acidobacteriota bacterium]
MIFNNTDYIKTAVFLLVSIFFFTSCVVRVYDRDLPDPNNYSVNSDWEQEGIASWYGDEFHGRQTANGETYNMYAYTAAHRTLPFNTMLLVVNQDNGKEVKVRVNDRGPFIKGRILDLSYAAAKALDMIVSGTATVKIYILKEE